MKSIYRINSFFLICNLLLFIVPCFGLLAMIPLGIIQLTTAIGISLTFYRKINFELKKILKIYWLLVGLDSLYIMLYINLKKSHYDIYEIIFFAYPMLIACYFVYVTYRINKFINPKEE
ncbi:hypothetical protein V1389_00240 [Flavobacterium rakeshii]|uniref:hypothetical protein n=1 Tax=Flavobacterium rakeshii TaxID=1038845 RepID=UPI002E7B8433|nr:hypothetical protein [Flavobacterium rakeshii]MEE1896741.1 hypothetical protein [Flavobacterium rakeshii]